MAKWINVALMLAQILDVHGDGHCSSRLDAGINYINKDIRHPQKGVESASACCALCVKEKGCTVYSYSHEQKLCRFRNSTSGRTHQTNMASGYTGNPPPLPPKAPLATPNARQLEFMELEFTQVCLLVYLPFVFVSKKCWIVHTVPSTARIPGLRRLY